MNVRFAPEALAEIQEIISYIAIHNPRAASEIAERIFGLAENLLSANPGMGRPGRVTGTRELVVHKSYLLAYRQHGEGIDILTVRHTARMWPQGF